MPEWLTGSANDKKPCSVALSLVRSFNEYVPDLQRERPKLRALLLSAAIEERRLTEKLPVTLAIRPVCIMRCLAIFLARRKSRWYHSCCSQFSMLLGPAWRPVRDWHAAKSLRCKEKAERWDSILSGRYAVEETGRIFSPESRKYTCCARRIKDEEQIAGIIFLRLCGCSKLGAAGPEQ